MAIKSDTLTGLAHWASYLINGDSSGMEESEIALCDAWQKSIRPYRVVSTVDDSERFTWSAQLYGANCSSATVCDYVAHAETLPIIFRAEKDGEVTAVFPTLPADYQGRAMTCYAHIGQHSGCSFPWYQQTRAAKPPRQGSM